MELIDNQIRDNSPLETRLTLDRLVAEGLELEDARRLIGAVLAMEINDMLAQLRPFDEPAFVAALQRLPILPLD